MKLRSQAIQRGLPRPVAVNKGIASKESALTEVDALIRAELLAMLQNDAVHHPVKGVKPKTATEEFEQFEEEELKEAAALLVRELEELKSSAHYHELVYDEFVRLNEDARVEVIFVPSQQKYGKAGSVSKAERVASLQTCIHLQATRF